MKSSQQMTDHEIRTEGGVRLYSDQDLQRLRFIRYGRQPGFSLESVCQLLSIRVDPEHHTCQESKTIVQTRLLEVQTMMAELQQMERSPQRLNHACCGSGHSSNYCSILESLENGAPASVAD